MSSAFKLDLNQDYRQSGRLPVIEDARIISKKGGWSLLNCTIRDLSEGGARLEIDPALEIPTLFDLLFVREMKILSVRIRWRRRQFMGVEFIGEPREAPPFRLC
jgi:hypothetical protein